MPLETGIIRRAAIIPLLTSSVLLLGIAHLRLTHKLRHVIETFASSLNGAPVTLQSLHLNWLSGTIVLNGLEVADPKEIQRNRIETDHIQSHFSSAALLRGKILLSQVNLENIRTSILHKHPQPRSNLTGLHPDWKLSLEQQRALDQFKEQGERSPLDALPIALEKWDPTSEFISNRALLKSPTYLKTLTEQMAQLNLHWKTELEALPKVSEFLLIKAHLNRIRFDTLKDPADLQRIHAELLSTQELITQKTEVLKNKFHEFSQRLAQLESEVLKLEEVIQNDAQHVSTEFQWPALNAENLNYSLFGRDILANSEVILKFWNLWQAFRTHPHLTLLGEPQSSEGKNFQFGSQDTLPWFWIQHLRIQPTPHDSDAVALSGTLSHLRTQPHDDEPFLDFEVSGHLPPQDIRNLHLRFHHPDTDAHRSYQFHLSFDRDFNMPIQLFRNPNLMLEAQAEQVQFRLTAEFSTHTFHAHWQKTFPHTTLSSTSTNTILQDQLNGTLSNIHEIQLSADYQFTPEGSAFRIISNLGDALRTALQALTHERQVQAQKKIRELIEGKIRSQRHVIENQFSDFQSNVLRTLKQPLEDAQNTQAQVQAKLNLLRKQKTTPHPSQRPDPTPRGIL